MKSRAKAFTDDDFDLGGGSPSKKRKRKRFKIDCSNLSKEQIVKMRGDRLRQKDFSSMATLVKQLKKMRK